MSDKRYRECMAEIMGVLQRYDLAGAVTVVSKERAMFKYHFPSWTVIKLVPGTAEGGGGVHLRSKAADFPSREAQHQANELSAHVVMQMRDVAVNTVMMAETLAKVMREKWGMQHTPNAGYDPELDN